MTILQNTSSFLKYVVKPHVDTHKVGITLSLKKEGEEEKEERRKRVRRRKWRRRSMNPKIKMFTEENGMNLARI